MVSSYFSGNFSEAHNKFSLSCKKHNHSYISVRHPSRGIQNEDLYMSACIQRGFNSSIHNKESNVLLTFSGILHELILRRTWSRGILWFCNSNWDA
jgi:hypothetical protein